MRLSPFLLLSALALTGCSDFPELDSAGPASAVPPQLLPIDDILAQAQVQGTDPGPALSARAAALKARAAAISATP